MFAHVLAAHDQGGGRLAAIEIGHGMNLAALQGKKYAFYLGPRTRDRSVPGPGDRATLGFGACKRSDFFRSAPPTSIRFAFKRVAMR